MEVNMKSRNSQIMVLAVLLMVLPMYAIVGCKKKVRSADAESTGTFNEELLMQTESFGNEPVRQAEILLNYSLSEDDEDFIDDPNGGGEDYEEPNNDPEDDEEFEEEDDEYYDENEPDDGDYEEDPNDFDDEESRDDW
jgi:hypothetical protein